MNKSRTAIALLMLATVITTAFARPDAVEARAFEIDFDKLKAASGATHWRVLSSHNHGDLMTGRSKSKSQRIVATCRFDSKKQGKLTSAIEDELDRQMAAAGAISKGEWSANMAMGTREFGTDESIQICAPRIQFAIDGNYGVLDLNVSAHNGHVTFTISCTQ